MTIANSGDIAATTARASVGEMFGNTPHERGSRAVFLRGQARVFKNRQHQAFTYVGLAVDARPGEDLTKELTYSN